MPSELEPPQKLLTVGQVAERLQVSKWSVYRRVAERQIPAVKLGTGPRSPLRVDERELERWLYSDENEANERVRCPG